MKKKQTIINKFNSNVTSSKVLMSLSRSIANRLLSYLSIFIASFHSTFSCILAEYS